ncbi:hypothetical protein [Desulfobulbus elongatus]|uniref:phage major capsid protein n=1 Tax=Desulfobulbus elongatus TaxID=53332 RepID=UPI000487F602|nr:hypothetical protein [Desulfobulbus elongatus]
MTTVIERLQAAVTDMGQDDLLQAASILLAADGDPDDADYGYKWRVRVVEYGLGRDGRVNWPRGPLQAALPLYDGAKVFALQDQQHQSPGKPFGKSVREIVGWLANPADTGDGIEADFYVLKSARWLRDNLVDSHRRGNPNLFGLSHDVAARSRQVRVGDKVVKEPVEILGVEVDVVYAPTNNGRFLRMMAASGQEESMKYKEKLLAALKAAKPQVYATVDVETVTEDELIGLLAAVEQPEDKGARDAGIEARIHAAMAALGEPVQQQLRDLKIARLDLELDRQLAASKLPEDAQASLRGRFGGTEWDAEQLTAAVREMKEILDKASGSGLPSGAGGARVVLDSVEKIQAGFDKLFRVQTADSVAAIPAFASIRAAYVELTGDTEVRGYYENGQPPARLHAAYTSATFAYALGNTLYRRMMQDYREQSDFGVGRLVGAHIRNARDFRALESVNIGYYGDLPDIDPEDNDYTDLGVVSDEEISYALNQKGGIITITRKMIVNDDMRVVERIISRLPRAARRTLAKRCWNKFIANATYKGDSKAVFHDDHGNLGSAAYSIAAALAAKTAMAQQTEPESGERLMLRPVTVAYPSELYNIVKNVNAFQPQAVSVDNGNSMAGFFQSEGLVECPFMTDANDWMMFADPAEVEILELAFLNGQQEPEMFVADQPGVGQMFVADKIQYKIRHEYECEIMDYRGCYKAVVAPPQG